MNTTTGIPIERGQVALCIRNRAGQDIVTRLNPDTSVFLGSGKSCGIVLHDDKLSAKHCLLRYFNGRVTITDWCSASGTRVDGRTIEGETEVRDGSQVGVGDSLINVRFCDAGNEPVPDASRSNGEAKLLPLAAKESTKVVNSSVASATMKLTELSEFDKFKNRFDTFDSQHDVIRLLEAEIESLRSELADRDAQLNELQGLVAADHLNTVPGETLEEEGCNHRINELLDELKRSDLRIRTLEDLLRLSEDATQAEQEERKQIEIWVDELEHRVSNRELEWRAEIEILNERIRKLCDDRTQAEQQLRQAAANPAGGSQEKVIRELQLEVSDLRQQLATAGSENKDLRSELESADFQTMLKRNQQLVDAELREEQLKMSQERAAFSRQKSELLRRVTELERELAERKRPNDCDVRFQAFREHLREIHDQERQPTNPATTLSKRLVELWKRLDTPYGPG
jgi:hypothetical protein